MLKKVTLFSVLALAASAGMAGCAKRPYICSCDCSSQAPQSSTPGQSSIPSKSQESQSISPVPQSYENVNEHIIVWCAAEEEQVMKKVVDEYNSKQTKDTSKFNYEFVAVAEADGGTEIAKNPSAASAAAMFNFADDQLYSLQSKNILVEYTGEYRNRAVNNNTEFSLRGAMYGDKLYGVPYTADNGYFLWYDADYLSDDDVQSLEKILDKAQNNNKAFLMDVSNGYYQSSFMLSPEACGTESLRWYENDDGNAVYVTNWDDSQGVKVCEYLNNLLQPLYDLDYVRTGSNPEIAAGLQPGGDLIAAVSGTWMEASVVGKGRNIKACKLPEYHPDGMDKPGYQMSSYAGSKLLGINNMISTEKKRAAVALADLMTSESAQRVRLDLRKTLPSNEALNSSEELKEKMTIGGKALNAQLDTQAYAMQSSTAESRFWDIGKMIGQAWLDGDLGKFGNWQEFLTFQMNLLRNA